MNIPKDLNSRLGYFTSGGVNYYSLRQGSEVIFFQYDPNTTQISLVNATWTVPENIETHYWNTKDGCIYFGY